MRRYGSDGRGWDTLCEGGLVITSFWRCLVDLIFESFRFLSRLIVCVRLVAILIIMNDMSLMNMAHGVRLECWPRAHHVTIDRC